MRKPGASTSGGGGRERESRRVGARRRRGRSGRRETRRAPRSDPDEDAAERGEAGELVDVLGDYGLPEVEPVLDAGCDALGFLEKVMRKVRKGGAAEAPAHDRDEHEGDREGAAWHFGIW